MKNKDQLEEASQTLVRLIQQTAWHSTPTPIATPTNMENIPLHIRELVREKRRARARWHRTRNNEDRLIYNRLRRKLHNTLNKVRNNTFEHYVTSISKDDHTIWKATKKFKRPQVTIPPIRKPDRSWAKSDIQKTTAFAEHLEKVFTTPPYRN